jgi:prepilin-type N-terminal cleavage/methylation domain-containing protein
MGNNRTVALIGQSGVSLVELLVVLVIIAIVSALALTQRGSSNRQFQRQNVAVQLKNAFERARFDSVKRRPADVSQQAKVTVTPTTYTLRTDSNFDGTLNSADDVVATLPAGIVIAPYGGGALVTQDVTFNMRGEVPTSPSPQFYVCNISCSNPSDSNANIVIVTPTGTVNMLPGGSSLPTFGVPSIISVPTNTGVNPDTVVTP